MALALSPTLVRRLQELARSRGVDAQRLLDDAVEQFVEAAAITDLTPEDVARTQEAMLGELGLPEWDQGSKQ
jgi:predicted transcriptional regulator